MDTPEYTVNQDKINSVFADRRNFKRWLKDNQIGIYVAVILHLLIFLIMAIHKIHTFSSHNYMAVIELVPHIPQKTPEEQRREEEEKIKREVDKTLKNILNQDNKTPNLVSNAAVEGTATGRGGANVSFFSTVNTATLKEEKQKQKSEENKVKQGVDDVPTEAKASTSGTAYKGPSVVSYYLKDRVGISIPVPAYKCLNGGDVTVIIEVNNLGFVVNAHVDTSLSSKDECLMDAAVQAALTARFSSSENSGNQKGNIVYRFISQ